MNFRYTWIETTFESKHIISLRKNMDAIKHKNYPVKLKINNLLRMNSDMEIANVIEMSLSRNMSFGKLISFIV